jgi:hypothetical protein
VEQVHLGLELELQALEIVVQESPRLVQLELLPLLDELSRYQRRLFLLRLVLLVLALPQPII